MPDVSTKEPVAVQAEPAKVAGEAGGPGGPPPARMAVSGSDDGSGHTLEVAETFRGLFTGRCVRCGWSMSSAPDVDTIEAGHQIHLDNTFGVAEEEDSDG